MAEIPEAERCIAITHSGSRCSRMAKGNRFCFQHDDSFETVDGVDSGEDGLLVSISEHLPNAPEQLSGVQQDIAQNLNDVAAHAGGIGNALKSLEFADAIDGFRSTVTSTGPSAGTGALIGGVVGSPLGPVGIATGATAGGWYGVYRSMKDGRAVAATVVDEEDVPSDATIHSSDHAAIVDSEPIRLAMESAMETGGGRSEWLRSTLTRERDMDAVTNALEQLDSYDSDEGSRSYFVKDEEREVVLQVFFGEPQEE
ncbi:DUF5763 domain-containing protein [Haloarchaeobius sp. FL176]|uniref:DUF5763 domain-containing protein n=1 Tax=Haloarchaeobius sp. FL176 TaxID=2967129 RepID=UPI0021480581|nr:DUF5763 domain-containing protein [Haloarchaeobius sp. FL176]